MIVLFIAMTVGLLAWWFLLPTATFLRGFAGLIEGSDYRIASLITHQPRVSGRFHGRAVVLQLHQPGENRYGVLELLMETSAAPGARWKDSAIVSRHPEIGRATFDLEGKYSLVLTLSGGWLRASSSPLGVRFPGPFDAEKWENVLTQMETVAVWLESVASR
jgi:hypothetical protein